MIEQKALSALPLNTQSKNKIPKLNNQYRIQKSNNKIQKLNEEYKNIIYYPSNKE